MNARKRFKELHRIARLGNLGTLTFRAGNDYDWFLTEVYDIRHPRIGGGRHCCPGSFDSLALGTVRRERIRRNIIHAQGIKFCQLCKGWHHVRRDCATEAQR